MTTNADVQSLFPLKLQNVSLNLNEKPVLKDVNLTISDHGVTVILGHNGAGKSMLLKILHGLLQPSSGTIHWGDTNHASDQVRRRQAMVFQKPVLLKRSVEANIKYALDLPHSHSKWSCVELLEHAELTPLANRAARSLSGGEQQRLAFARAMATGPEVLFLDEPTANLDPDATLHLESLIQTASASDIKVFLVTHDMGQAKRLATEILFMRNGSVEEHALKEDFFNRPSSPYCQSFIDGVLLSNNH